MQLLKIFCWNLINYELDRTFFRRNPVATPAKHVYVFKDQAARRRFIANFRLLKAGKLLCKNHEDRKAVAICNYCGYGTCRECTVIFGLNRYCTDDAEVALKREKALKESGVRGPMITAASALSYVEGALTAGVGFLFLILGVMAPAAQSSSPYVGIWSGFEYFNPVFLYPQATIIFLGGVLFSLGILDLAVGTYLWRRSRMAGIVEVVACILTVLIFVSFSAVFAVVALLLYALILLGVTEIGAIVAGWSHLR